MYEKEKFTYNLYRYFIEVLDLKSNGNEIGSFFDKLSCLSNQQLEKLGEVLKETSKEGIANSAKRNQISQLFKLLKINIAKAKVQ